VREQVAHGRKVLVTTGPDEGAVLEKFRGTGAVLCGGEQALGLDFLAALIKEARVVVVPSTGPLHMAAALEKRIVTFFPTIRVQSAVRWGPYVDPSRGDVKVMTLGESSDKVSVQDVSAELDRLW
jgi:ADP-heptose:LPS heptosyltransferase